MKKFQGSLLLLFLFFNAAQGQRTEVTISLSEQFFDTLLDAVYQNAAAPEFPLAKVDRIETPRPGSVYNTAYSFAEMPASDLNAGSACSETIKLVREMNGVRTAVRFREGKIFTPLAFSGNYNPPFIGCINFAGYAETNIELEFDQASQRLVARARVLNVVLNGTGGIGGDVIARLVQSSIDKKINPMTIIQLDKVSFVVPIQNSSSLKMKAVGIRHEIAEGYLKVHIQYEFLKS